MGWSMVPLASTLNRYNVGDTIEWTYPNDVTIAGVISEVAFGEQVKVRLVGFGMSFILNDDQVIHISETQQ